MGRGRLKKQKDTDNNIDEDKKILEDGLDEKIRNEVISQFLHRYKLDIGKIEQVKIDDRPAITDLCILLQEFSRRSMNWPLIKIGKLVSKNTHYIYQGKYKINRKQFMSYGSYYAHDDEKNEKKFQIPTEVIEYLEINGEKMILAGGSISDMICGRLPKDYDLFCIGERPQINTVNMIETINSYTTIKYPKIQIIKRIYSSPEQVIGGFDMEPSKFFVDHNLDVFCTVGALMCLFYQMNPININSYSSTFVRRINKYKRAKGFQPVFNNQIKVDNCCPFNRATFIIQDKERHYFNDYSIELSIHKTMGFDDKIFFLNFCSMMRDEKDGYCIAGGEIIPKQKFLDHAKELYKKEMNESFWVYDFHRRNHILPKISNTNTFAEIFQRRNDLNKFVRYGWRGDKDMLKKNIYFMRIDRIEKSYNDYVSIVDKFRISNPGTQHTSSFHPVQFKTLGEAEEFKKKFFGQRYRKHDHSTPDIVCFLMYAKRIILPRPITYLIGCFVCAFKLFEYIPKEAEPKNEQQEENRNEENDRKRKFTDNLSESNSSSQSEENN
eukprot:TRINITY_DN1161_c0_g3_i2.p1 TRINITY_DN1161_c0_g3~~TRINITY_DN1161_c0_g3_i2.p1  ORF type:complete len:551 (+),score=161.26 TRINITY_DN1161_c0_g3_i2:120-1772(+)